jgi:predicted MFS family arabinose efflux permease
LALGLGAVIVPFGWLMRRNLVETLDVPATRSAAAPSDPWMPNYRRVALLGLAMLAAATTTNYVLDYMTTYANATLGMPERLALGATVMVGLCGLVCDPLSGWLSDRIGRKPVMVVPWVVLLLVIFRRSGCWGASAPASRSLALRRYWRSPRRCRPAPCWRR